MPVKGKGRIIEESEEIPKVESVDPVGGSPPPFDFRKYTLSRDVEKKILTIPDSDETFEVSVRPMSWAKKNQIISASLTFGAEGTSGFDGDSYVRNCLKEVLVEAPWGRTTEAFLLTIDDRLGSALEALVPKAFGNDDANSVDIENVKKE
jgi:hypothetical protein